MTKKEKLLIDAKAKIDLLNFEECIKLHNSIPKPNPMSDLIFDRMEELDIERFDNWLDSELGF